MVIHQMSPIQFVLNVTLNVPNVMDPQKTTVLVVNWLTIYILVNVSLVLMNVLNAKDRLWMNV